MKKYVIAGGSGFLGRALSKHWAEQGVNVIILSRKKEPTSTPCDTRLWDGESLGEWTGALEGADVLINLAGKSVDCRYTEPNRAEILRSRIDSTVVLSEALQKIQSRPSIWINASSATIYRHAEDRGMTEDDGELGHDFSMDVVHAWEKEFFKVPLPGIRKVAARTSIVIGAEGGAFPKMRLLTKCGLGGRQGNGRQMVSWIHIQDFCRAIDHLIGHQEINGPVNITSPYPLTNQYFMKALRQRLNIPFGLRTPKPLLELASWLLRTESELLLKSRWVIPQRLIDSNFTFCHGRIEQALAELKENELKTLLREEVEFNTLDEHGSIKKK